MLFVAQCLSTIMPIILTMIIERPGEVERLGAGNWRLVFGRRKTGKSYLVENCTKYDDYFFVGRDRRIIEKVRWTEHGYDGFREILRRDLDGGKSVVVDEFHRLGDDFLDYLHALPQKGQLTIISSTLHTARMLFNRRSPLLGKFAEVKIPIIGLRDALAAVQGKELGPREMMEKAVLLREPIAIQLLEKGGTRRVMEMLRLTVPGLIGEIFSEEDRKLSAVYEGVIRAAAIGKTTSGEMSSYLFSRKLLARDDPSLLQQYLDNLIEFGILYRIPVWGRNRMVYKHVSPLTRMYYYLDEKYGIGERELSADETASFMREIMPRIIEDAVRESMAEYLGMRSYLHEAADFEVDGIFSRFKKPDVALEVKWGRNVSAGEVMRARERLERIPAPKKILFVADKKGMRAGGMELMDARDLLAGPADH